MKYPEYAKIDGERYKLNTSFKTALKCLEIINDSSIGDSERAMAIIYKLFGFIPEGDESLLRKFLEKAQIFLEAGQKAEGGAGKRVFDHNKDFPFVSASFASDYHIDLSKEDVHWWRYCELLNGLTESCALSNVIKIRQYDLKEVKDSKLRNTIADLQERFSLEDEEDNFTEEQRRAIDDFDEKYG